MIYLTLASKTVVINIAILSLYKEIPRHFSSITERVQWISNVSMLSTVNWVQWQIIESSKNAHCDENQKQQKNEMK